MRAVSGTPSAAPAGLDQAAHGNSQLPKFQLRNTDGHAILYQAVLALQRDLPGLSMDIRPNLKGEYVLTHKDDESAARISALIVAGDTAARLVQLDPAERRSKVVLQRYPLELPLEVVRDHPHVVSAERLRAARDKAPTCQVLVQLVGAATDKLDQGPWGRHFLRPYDKEPRRCHKCQHYNNLQGRCPHPTRCGVCSLRHSTEDCIRRHKVHETTTATCPSCAKKHHVWHPRCPERLRRLPGGGL